MPTHFSFGAAGYLKFGSTVLSPDARHFDVEEEMNFWDASAGADTSRTYYNGLLDGKAVAELLGSPGGTALWAALKPGTTGTLEWGEEGTAAGKPKHYVTAKVARRKRVLPYDDLVVLQIDWQFSDVNGVTDGTY